MHTLSPAHLLRLLSLSVGLLLLSGCLSGPQPATGPHSVNAVEIPAERVDLVWERALAVLHSNHFEVARESRIEGLIETHYRAGSGLFEPWHHDSIGYANRLESTIQSLRRKVTVLFQNSSPGIVTVSVLVEKEIEDVPGLAATYEGGATFSEAQPLERDLDQVVGQAGPSRWLPRGRDHALEVTLMRQLQFNGS